jgi:hypothetical protein
MRGINLPQRQLVSQQDASVIPRADVARSRFLGSWTRKTAFDAGYLVPFLVDEILPGDMMKYRVTAMIRMSTPKFPIMDNQRIDTFFFFVPNRLVWNNWVKFMGEQDNPADSIAYTVPVYNSPAGGFAENSLFAHLGIPTVGQITAGQTISVNAMPIRGYGLIWNEWFRDENLQNSFVVPTGDGPDSGVYTMLLRAKSHDYFTSCLPWAQKFTPPTAPLTGSAPVTGIGKANQAFPSGPASFWETNAAATTAYTNFEYASVANAFAIRGSGAAGATPQIFANLNAVSSGLSINALRQAWMVQMLLERDARGGTRYVEIVKSHFGVISPDARQQRPEFIGGGSTPLVITPVAQTATGGSGVGALGAAGTAAGGHSASYAATEHGFIIGLINVRTELSYQQGLHKMWSRATRYDYFWPVLAGLGEQAVLNQEIYCTGTDATDTAVFGYQERYQEYRTRYSEVVGVLNSRSTGTLDAWHFAQNFLVAPTLNSTFIQDTPDMARVLNASLASANQQYIGDILIERDATRPIPMFGVPASIGRF